MSSDVNIRLVSETDIAALYALYRQLESPSSSVTPERLITLLKQVSTYPDYHVFVAEVAGGVVGTFALLIFEALGERCQPVGVVEDVVVDRESRGRGIGKKMMEFAMERCRKRGCYKMMLSSNASRTEAHRFYESLGFERHGFSFSIPLLP